LARDSLLFSPVRPGSDSLLALPLSELTGHGGSPASGAVPALTRARCVFECGDSEISRRFGELRREALAACGANASRMARLREPLEDPAWPCVSAFADMRGGLDDVERAARFLQLTSSRNGFDDPAPTAAAVFHVAGAEPLAQAAALWRDLQGITSLIGEEGFDVDGARPKVKSLVANACGHEDFDGLQSLVTETASRAAAEIDRLHARA